MEAYAALGLVVTEEQEAEDKRRAAAAAALAHAEATRAEAASIEDSARARAELLAWLESMPSAEMTEEEAARIREALLARVADEQDALRQSRAAQDEYWAESKAAALEAEAEIKATYSSIAEAALASSITIADAVVAGYQQQAAAGHELTDEQRKAAEVAFGVAQALALAQAEIAALQTGANVVNALTAAFVPFPAALVAGAAATSIMLAGSVASIAAQPPPEFPTGMSPDHIPVGIRPDEGIASPRAMRQLGSDGLDALNEGRGLGGETELGERTLRALERMFTRRPAAGGGSVVRARSGRRTMYGGW
jgi:hypothetical protein